MLFNSDQYPQKDKTEVMVTLVNGNALRGHFYVTTTQRIGDLLNDQRDFLPFEDAGQQIRLINKSHIVDVQPTCQETDDSMKASRPATSGDERMARTGSLRLSKDRRRDE